jgi:hypothetical protein
VVLFTKGKSAQDIFGECIVRKNRGAKFIMEGGTELFHTAEELHEFFVRAEMVAVAHIDYAPFALEENWLQNMPNDEESGWGADELNQEICDKAVATAPQQESLSNTVAEADRAIGGWKDVHRNVTVHLPGSQVTRQTNLDGSPLVLPIRPEDRPTCEGIALKRGAGHVEHTKIINCQAVHLGWAACNDNQFGALAVPAPPTQVDEPSEVGPNA